MNYVEQEISCTVTKAQAFNHYKAKDKKD